jgi:putative glutamine transport system substrate-binding protein
MRILSFLLLSLMVLPLSAQTSLSSSGSQKSTPEVKFVTVHYLVRPPLAMKSEASGASMPKGLEVDIFMQFVNWLKDNKNIALKPTWKAQTDFDVFYKSVREGDALTLGFGNATITERRKQEVAFSPAYLNNVSVFITDGSIPTISSDGQIAEALKGLNGVSSAGSTHAGYMAELKRTVLPNLTMEFVGDQNNIPRKILTKPGYCGYVDIITYWNFIKETKGYLKMHRHLSKDHESIGFMMPKSGELEGYLNEFFESGFGFTSTKKYREILETYLGYEIISTVEVN